MVNINLNPESISGTPFEPIVEAINWQDPATPSCLRVASGLGWMVGVDDAERINAVVGFSVEAVESGGVLHPPKDVVEVNERLDRRISSFNSDLAAKGIGSTIANTPRALQPGSFPEAGIAVRSIPVGPRTMLHMRSEADASSSPTRLLARHLGLLVFSASANVGTFSAKGTDWAARYMERDYDGARLVHMAAPPIWQIKQGMADIPQSVPPQIMLVRGRQFATSNPMTRIGLYPA